MQDDKRGSSELAWRQTSIFKRPRYVWKFGTGGLWEKLGRMGQKENCNVNEYTTEAKVSQNFITVINGPNPQIWSIWTEADGSLLQLYRTFKADPRDSYSPETLRMQNWIRIFFHWSKTSYLKAWKKSTKRNTLLKIGSVSIMKFKAPCSGRQGRAYIVKHNVPKCMVSLESKRFLQLWKLRNCTK